MQKRKIFRLIHLYLGAAAGLIVFIEAVTGALWVFKDEIESATQPEIVIENQTGPTITPTFAKEKAQEVIEGKAIHGVLYPNESDQPIEVIFYETEPEFFYSLFLNPYSGEVLSRKDHLRGFFAFILDGHLHLWLPPKIGEPLVSYGTLVFLISIITGIVLWWPKNQKGRKQRLKFDWKNTTKWRRKNFDIHTVLGFYVSAFAMTFVITGLVMGLNWFYFVFYSVIGGNNEMQFIIPKNISEYSQKKIDDKPIDQLPEILRATYPTARDFEIHFPYSDSVSIYVEVSYKDGVYYDSDYIFFDQATLEDVSTTSIYGRFRDANLPDHIMRANYDIHVGAIGGLPTKILMFISCLIIATLPITGGLIWYGRTQKKSKKN